MTADDGNPAVIALHRGDEGVIRADIPVKGRHAAVVRGAIPVLPPGPASPLAAATGAREVPLAMEGGALGGLVIGIWQGERMSIRALVENGKVRTPGGVAGSPGAPLLDAEQGETIRIPMTNDTAFAHAMHLHRYHFRKMRPDGRLGPLRDTLMLARGESRGIVLRADNPGVLLLHCHMLSHRATGMKTWARVTA